MSQGKNFSDSIASCVLSKYEKLSKKGKPTRKNESTIEWTVLAGISSIECVALGTGTKCLGGSALSKFGDLVNDSHAEIVARRAFNLYLLEQLSFSLKNTNSPDSIFLIPTSNTVDSSNFLPNHTDPRLLLDKAPKIKLKDEFKFHFYASQCPCGDASTNFLLSILDNDSQNFSLDELKVPKNTQKNKAETDPTHPSPKKRRKTNSNSSDKKLDILLPDDANHNSSNHPLRGRENFSILNSLRTKPGRLDSDSTLSMSCSDKIALWNLTGVQSALLSLFVQPIYISSFVISDHIYIKEVDRSLNQRIKEVKGLKAPFICNTMEIYRTDLKFCHSLSQVSAKFPKISKIPCESSINWYTHVENPKDTNSHEVIVQGKKQGSPKHKPDTVIKLKFRSRICKLEIFRAFVEFAKDYLLLPGYSKNSDHSNSNSNSSESKGKSDLLNIEFLDYKTIKNFAADYQGTKCLIKSSIFKDWVKKPSNNEPYNYEKYIFLFNEA
ncbi:hypothetical protein BB560_005731, partial [Smittium megazygosporum]